MLASLLLFIGAACYVSTAPATVDSLQIVSVAVNQPSSRAVSLDKHVSVIASFWTDDKLAAAQPIMPSLNVNPQSTAKADTINKDPPVFVNGTFGSLQKAAEAAAGSGQSTGRQVFGYTGRQTYTTGRIFWNITATSYGMCSGAVITAGNKDTIVTAGHCCYDYDAKKWRINQNFIFIPAYKGGALTNQKWVARMMTAYTGWTVNQNYNYDVCFVNLYTNSKSQHIQDLQGSEDIGANYPRNALTYSFGYPYNLAQGEIMQYCSGTAASSRADGGYIGQTIPCDMAGGCSGGPWLQNFVDSTGIGVVTSLNSFLLTTFPNYLNGPYFDTSFWSLYQQSAIK